MPQAEVITEFLSEHLVVLKVFTPGELGHHIFRYYPQQDRTVFSKADSDIPLELDERNRNVLINWCKKELTSLPGKRN